MGHLISRFRRAEDGSMVLFGVLMLILMLAVAGMAVDLMRSEHKRVELQNTLDRAILAAADLEQTLDPEAVVNDYFAKAGLTQYLTGVNVTEGFSSRQVAATANAVVPTIFMGMIGIDEMPTPVGGAAAEGVTNIEITLVLDVSNSMNSNNRLPNLKVAARDFVDTIYSQPNSEDLISISIVPYTGQVNAGSGLLSNYNVTGVHSFGNCIDHSPSVYNTTALDNTAAMARFDVFDPWHATRTIQMTYCPQHPSQEIMAYSNDPAALKAKINSLVADGNTSIEIGMKWGVATLDPSFSPVLGNLIAQGKVDPQFSDRPYAHGQQDTQKFIVLMSDGENTDEFFIKSGFDEGLSPIWRRNSNGNLSMLHNNVGQYWRDNSNTWATTPDGGFGGATQLSWPEVWNEVPVRYYAARLVMDALGGGIGTFNGALNSALGSIPPAVKNARTQQICTNARQAKMTVYTIGFEAPAGGLNTLRNCATSINHFYDVNGTDIAAAFQSIARDISKLRLTQ